MKKGKKAQMALGGRNSKKGIRGARKAVQQVHRRQNVLGETQERGKGVPEIPALEKSAEVIVSHSAEQSFTVSEPVITDIPAKQFASETESSEYKEENETSYEDYF